VEDQPLPDRRHARLEADPPGVVAQAPETIDQGQPGAADRGDVGAVPDIAASGFSRLVQVLKTRTSACSGSVDSPRPSDSNMPLIRSESWAFI
jgi:hypothetical protein